MQIAKCQCLPSAKTRSCREYARLLASVLEVFFTCVVMMKPVACQASQSSMQLNSTLLSNQTLVSPGGVFALGFYSATRAQVASPVYTLAIWYAHTSPAKTVVWFPDRALALSENASLSLSPQGDLQVHDNIGSPQLMWTSNTAQLHGTTATILDTGNLVVVNSTNDVVWQSFDRPTDTLLPSQSYTANSIGSMKAWRASGDWSDSPYSLNWDIVRTLNASFLSTTEIYHTLSHPTNWSYWSNKKRASSVFLTKQGQFQSVSRNLSKITLIANSKSGAGLVSTRLLRLTLDADGNLRMYSWWNESSVWEVEWEAIEDVCKIFGYCGPFALCSNNGECTCPVGFQFVNPVDPRQGCSRVGSEALCSINKLVPVDFIDYPFSGDYMYRKSMKFEDCLQSCLSDCYCQAAMVRLPQQSIAECWLKKDILINGQSGPNRTVFMRVREQPHGDSSGLSDSSKVNFVTSSLGTGIFVLGLLLCVFAGFSLVGKMKQSRLLQLQRKWATGKDASLPVRFTYEDIQLITNNFAMDIGISSGSGTVFKGHVGDPNDHTDVAVKFLQELGYEADEFINKVDIIGRIHHFHLANLLGYCAEAEHRILVYEHVEDGSLDGLLFQRDKSKSVVLEWRPRFQIAIQTAQALAYLHHECHPSLVHGNVKPETILVDSMMCVKVAEFGLSSIMPGSEPIQSDSTCECLAPAWTNQEMPVTSKSDVFSFGMLLLELLSGRRNVTTCSVSHQLTDLYFPSWAYPYIETASFMDVLDPSLTGIVNPEEVQRALLVAFWCINDQPHLRPSMARVMQMLEGAVPVEVPVPRPNFLDTLQMEEDEEGSIGGHPLSDLLMPRSHLSKGLLFEGVEDGSLTLNIPCVKSLARACLEQDSHFFSLQLAVCATFGCRSCHQTLLSVSSSIPQSEDDSRSMFTSG